MAEAGIQPDWVAGISIGAVNAAIIAGNPPDERVGKLRRFWQSITTVFPWDQSCVAGSTWCQESAARGLLNGLSAYSALMSGAANFFAPRLPPPWLAKSGSPDATSYYDTSGLKALLEELIDFDRINNGKTRLSVGSVNVRTGNLVYFDSTTHKIGPDHVMASAALPPGFPAVEIEGEYYWDGGLVSNTPLKWVVDNLHDQDLLAFQIDLWSAEGAFPRDLADVTTRQKEIQFSSRTRANTDRFKHIHKMRRAIAGHLDQLPQALRDTPGAKLLSRLASRKVVNIVHLIYHTRLYERASKDFEFSRLSMTDHWQAGYRDALLTLGHPEVLEHPTNAEGISIFDFSENDSTAAASLQEAAQ
jgi:NTE family protein